MAKAKAKPVLMWAILLGDCYESFYDTRSAARIAASWVGGSVVRVSVRIEK